MDADAHKKRLEEEKERATAPFADSALKLIARLGPVVSLLKAVVPASVRTALLRPIYRRAIWHLPDRRYMEATIIPFLAEWGAKKVLLIGCRRYTMQYPSMLAARGIVAWTIDIDPEAAEFGAPNRHLVGDASTLDLMPECHGFDAVICSGVLGYGIDEPAAIRRCFLGLARVLTPGSLLVIGWDRDRTDDILAVVECEEFFDRITHSSVPSRQTFPNSAHVFDFMLRNSRVVESV
jgi:hypothetical protein